MKSQKVGTYNREAGTPNKNERKRKNEADFRGDIFLYFAIRNQDKKLTGRERSNNEVMRRTYVSTCFEALCTITSVKEKCLVALNEADLIAETLDLLQSAHFESLSTEIRVAFGFARHVCLPRRA
jgi:hypothetical protein